MHRKLLVAALLLLNGCALAMPAPIPAGGGMSESRQEWLAEQEAERQAASDRACEVARAAVAGRPNVETLAGSGCFAGSVRSIRNPFKKELTRTFDDGAYAMVDSYSGAALVYRGKFVFFHDRSGPGTAPYGTFVLVGKRIAPDGAETVGLFVAEDAISTGSIGLVLADQPYIDRIEEKHREEVQAFREEQHRIVASKRKKSSFSFGQALAIGLGAVAIASADIPADKMADVAVAYTKDVMSDGKAGALDDLRQQQRAEFQASQQAHGKRMAPSARTASRSADAAPTADGPHPLVGWWNLVGVACPAKIRFGDNGEGELRGFDCEDSCPGGVRLHFRWQATASPSGIATLTFTVFDICGKRSTTPPRPREGEILHGVENEVVYTLPMLSPARYAVETANGTYGRWTIERVR